MEEREQQHDAANAHAPLRVLAKRPLERTADEVQVLAAHLAGSPFFSTMRSDVLEHLCTLVGHARVEEGQPVYAQGQVGDCMYVVTQGCVEVVKQQQPTSAGDYSSSGGSSAHSMPTSRRATVELQVQQFALATSGGGAGAAAGSRRVSGAAGRRVTTEQMVQQQLAESQHLEWLSVGDSFGQAALVNPEQRRPVSVVAGDGGATLLVLDRATFNRLQAQAQQEMHQHGLAGATLQAVLAAACRPLLHSSRDSRTADEAETLAELFAGLEAFRALPADVRARLAKACQGLQLPPGAVAFQEGEEGDSMYVVVSGTLQVRARALQQQQQQQQQAPAQPASGASAGMSLSGTPAAAGVTHADPAAGRSVRATADAVLATCGSGSMNARAATRRTTWEPSTQQPGRTVTCEAARDAGFWTAKFFEAAAEKTAASDPIYGLGGGMTPLQACFAAQWRQQARQQQAVQAAQTAVEDEAAAQDKAFTAMEAMLGKAAARAWKVSRDAAATTSGSAQPPGDATAPATSSSLTTATPHSSAAGGGEEVGAGEAGNTPAAAGADGENSPRSSPPAADADESSPQSGDALAVSAATQAAAADVSRALLAELGARASLDGLLQAVAGALEQKGLPQRLSKSSSLKITRELNKRMLAGASWRSFGGSSSSSMRQQQQPEELDSGTSGAGAHASQDRQNRRTVSFRDTRGAAAGPEGADAADAEAELEAIATGLQELPGEATGMSSCDWRSLDGSETASLCMSVDGEASTLDNLDRAASGEGLGGGGCGQPQDLAAAAAAQQHSPEDLTALFGPVSRVLCTGESTGEDALLQRCAKRTVTVVVAPAPAPSAAEAAGGERASSSGATAPAAQAGGGALLIKVSRAVYDHTVRALQVAALEELLAFLGGLPAFAGLSRGALTSLAVFIQPRQVQPGQSVVVAGSPADALIILQEGELKLLDVASSSPAAAAATSPRQPGALPRSRRTTSEPEAVTKQLSGNGRSSVAGGLASVFGASVLGMQLAVLGPGSLLGEQVLGLNADEDPLAAITAAPNRRARQAAMAAAALTHPATAVATRPCKLLVLAADDLRRFGRRVRAPLAAAATARQDWLLQRRAAVRGGQACMAQVLPASVKQQESPTRSLLPADIGHGGGAFAGRRTSSGSAGSGGGQQAAGRRSTGGRASAAGSSGLWPGLTALLAPHGSRAAALLERQRRTTTMPSSSSASAAHRSQWQQQQWAEAAYAPAAASVQQRQQQPAVRVVDVGRLRQMVPSMQPPCVSELAAAIRPFPSGMLSATTTADQRSTPKGLRELLGT